MTKKSKTYRKEISKVDSLKLIQNSVREKQRLDGFFDGRFVVRTQKSKKTYQRKFKNERHRWIAVY